MLRYTLKRLLWCIPVVIGVAVVIFTFLYFTPGDPVANLLGEGYTQEQYITKRHQMGLDQPYIVQLGKFLFDFFIKFDFGISYMNEMPIKDDLLARIPRTVMISIIVIILNVIIGMPLGITAAVHQGKWQDKFCIFLAMVTNAIPNFWFAMILILVFSLELGWLPSHGIDSWTCYILPCISTGLMGIGGQARTTRSQMLEVIRADYVTTARSQGYSERNILYSHALPNAMIPMITGIGTRFAHALGGTIVIETLFSIPGTGTYMVRAISQRDYPVIRSTATLLSVYFSIVMVGVDLVYAFIDPRIKAQYENQGKKKVKKNA